MSPRPAMPVGTYGRITSRYLTPATAEAGVWFRDYDGVRRRVRRTGQTKTAAEHALKAALTDRQHSGSAGAITPATKLTDLADAWLAGEHGWAPNTRETYGYIVANQIKPALGGIRLSELRLSVVNRALGKIRETQGPGAAKTAKTVLSGMCQLAIQHEALESNPVRDAAPIRRARRKSNVRALSVAETDELCDKFRSDQRAMDLDLPDLVEWMLATGCRIGEACGARDADGPDGKPILDLAAGTWEVNATVIRVKGEGLRVQQWPKTAAGWRVLALPPFALAMARRRAGELRFRAPEAVIFASPLARRLRDPSNTAGDLRERLDVMGFDWVTSHVFRKTVATRMDEAGCTPREIADQLGHKKPSLTMDVYMGRNVVSAKAAKILDR